MKQKYKNTKKCLAEIVRVKAKSFSIIMIVENNARINLYVDNILGSDHLILCVGGLGIFGQGQRKLQPLSLH